MGEIIERDVNVTQEFIDKGCHNANACPLAEAFLVAFPEANQASVSGSGFWVGHADDELVRADTVAGGNFSTYDSFGWVTGILAPGQWVLEYDTDKPVKPFSFKVRGILGSYEPWEVIENA